MGYPISADSRTKLEKTKCRHHLLTAPKTYAGDIKAFANSKSLRERLPIAIGTFCIANA